MSEGSRVQSFPEPLKLRAVPDMVGRYTFGSMVSLNLKHDARDSAALIRKARQDRSDQIDRAVRGGD